MNAKLFTIYPNIGPNINRKAAGVRVFGHTADAAKLHRSL